ncbi:hypothetical protein Tco_0922191 [Tanacetum coccineum]|uniref:Uncharacterized protein n=1 Tax=Tanacetum coccineum TaxID=301880 RepID=A0ABQ5D054_9ASTR
MITALDSALFMGNWEIANMARLLFWVKDGKKSRDLVWGEKGAGKAVLSITGKGFGGLTLLAPQENKPMIEGNGLRWLFDIDSLTQPMNYVPVVAGTIINESADASYFESLSKDVDDGKPKSTVDDQKQVEDGLDNENDAKDKSNDDSSPKEVNAVGQHVNTASPNITTGSFKLNVVGLSINTASSYDQDSHKDMFTMGASHTLKATHVEFYSDEDEPEVDLGNITNSYIVPTTSNTRIHKDHPIKNVIGDVKSFVQTRRMTKPTSEQGFLSAVWILMDLPIGKRAIRIKWVFRNKKDERGIVIRNKAGGLPGYFDMKKVGDEAIHKELGDKMERAATTASSLEEEQDSDSIQALIDKKKISITESSIRSNLHLGDAGGTDCLPTAIIFEELAQMGKTLVAPSLCLSNQDPVFVLDLEKAKDAQAKEIADLKKRVQKLERKKKSRTTGLKRLRKVGMSRRVESSEDKDSLVDDTQGRSDDADMFDINELHGDEVLWICRLVRKKSRVQRKRE